MISVMQQMINNDSPEDSKESITSVQQTPFFWPSAAAAIPSIQGESRSERESETGSSPQLAPSSTGMVMPGTAGMYGFGPSRMPTANEFGMMMNPVYTDFYQNPLASTGWYSYGQPYQFTANYSIPSLDGNLSDITIPTTAGSSAATTPNAAMHLPWAISHDGKKKRQPYKKDQISRLEYEYSVNQYLTNKRRSELSAQLMLDEKQVKVWFQVCYRQYSAESLEIINVNFYLMS
nr:NOB-1B protein [Caenorhabditis elegans]